MEEAFAKKQQEYIFQSEANKYLKDPEALKTGVDQFNKGLNFFCELFG